MQELERELGEQELAQERLQGVQEAQGAALVRGAGKASQVEHLLEGAAREERRRQEQVGRRQGLS